VEHPQTDNGGCRTYGARDFFLLLSPALTGWAKVWRASGAPVDEEREIHGSEDPPLQRGIYVTVELETFACGVKHSAVRTAA
jgi:hypothetical protein